MCELLVGLPDINVLTVNDPPDAPIRVVIESRLQTTWCPGCGCRATVKDRPTVELVKVHALGLDETIFCRAGRWRTQQWCTSIVDVGPGVRLLDVVPGRNATAPNRLDR